MLRALPALIAIVLAIYCLVEVIQSRSEHVRLIPRWVWALIIIAIPIVGPIGWLAMGRPQRDDATAASTTAAAGPEAGERPVAPDDDPEFLEYLKRHRAQQQQEDKLRRWEQDLQRREQELGADDTSQGDTPPVEEDSSTRDQPGQSGQTGQSGQPKQSGHPEQPTERADEDQGGTSNGR